MKEEESSETDDNLEDEVPGCQGQGEEKKPVIISFYKKPATDGAKKVISFLKKNQSPSPDPGRSNKKNSKVKRPNLSPSICTVCSKMFSTKSERNEHEYLSHSK